MKVFLSSILSFSPLNPAGGVISAAGAAQGSRPSTPARASTTLQPADGGWPRAYITTSGARLVIYEPPIASWLDLQRLAMYAAVSSPLVDQSSTALAGGGAVHGPYGGARDAARYNPRTGRYARGAATWGPGGARSAARAWIVRFGTGVTRAEACGSQLSRAPGARLCGAQRTRDLGSSNHERLGQTVSGAGCCGPGSGCSRGGGLPGGRR
jgi:hypothetical protein